MKRADAEELTARVVDAIEKFDLSNGWHADPDIVFAIEHVIEDFAGVAQGEHGICKPERAGN